MVRFADASLEHGDLLLWRAGRWNVMNLLIGRAGRSRYVHASTVAIERWEARCVDTVQFRGGRNVCLRDQVQQYPGRIDVFRPWPGMPGFLGHSYDRKTAVATMLAVVGRRYGWRSVALAALLHLPIVRLFVRPATDDDEIARRPPFCSEARAIADRCAGFDPVPNLADRITEPGDLARSLFYKYVCTLEP